MLHPLAYPVDLEKPCVLLVMTEEFHGTHHKKIVREHERETKTKKKEMGPAPKAKPSRRPMKKKKEGRVHKASRSTQANESGVM